jgi:hypothetical protein
LEKRKEKKEAGNFKKWSAPPPFAKENFHLIIELSIK